MFDQRLPLKLDEFSVTVPPLQNVVGPEAVITGVFGNGFTETLIAFEFADKHPLLDA